MSITAYVGILYCVIGALHLIVLTIKRIKNRTFSEPEEIMIVTFAWPLIDMLWLMNVGSLSNKD